MWYRARILIGAIGVGLAAGVALSTAASAVETDPLVCGSVSGGTPAQVSCTVSGPEGSEATLVLAIEDTAGTEEAVASSKPISGTTATFTEPVPDGAARVIALALVDGTEVASAVVSLPQASAVDPVMLGVPNITVAGTAFGALAVGAIVVYASARRRGVENRRIDLYRGALT
ncbi:hypothetical protein [Demequina aestuarii]|uniref:hypothetical protein n=1 Tax=Demequina aestuarii TaxID=327095 RepID=UPI000781DCC5|nr:hypothetical protein [Demequina aestuarii]